jgi:hypothetical protein
MDNNEIIKKLIKIAKKQQVVIKKLAQQIGQPPPPQPQLEPTTVTKTPTQLIDEALENAGIFGAEIRMINPTAVQIANIDAEDRPHVLEIIRSVNDDLVVTFA